MEEKTLKTNKLTEFLQIMEEWRNDWGIGEHAIYRGQTDFNWILIAKLFRDPNAKPKNESDDPQQIQEQLIREHLKMKDAHNLERRLFQGFSRYLYAYRPDIVSTVPEEEKSNNAQAMQEWRQLALAQHYGLPTRLIDFTTNMLVALFFAVEEPVAHRETTTGEEQEQDSAVWCVDAPNRRPVWQVCKRKEDGVWMRPLEFANEGSDPPIVDFVDTAFVPEHIDGRIQAQGSVFMCEPRGKKKVLHEWLRDKGNTISNSEIGEKKDTPILKVRIPKDARKPLQEQLDLVGINRATLFPDLESAAKYLAWAVHQRKRPNLKKSDFLLNRQSETVNQQLLLDLKGLREFFVVIAIDFLRAYNAV